MMIIRGMKRYIKSIFGRNDRVNYKNITRLLDKEIVTPEQLAGVSLSASLEENLDFIGDLLGHNKDVIMRRFLLGTSPKILSAIIYIDGLSDNIIISNIMKALMLDMHEDSRQLSPSDLRDYIFETAVTIPNIKSTRQMDEVATAILSGYAVLMLKGLDDAVIIDIRGHKERSIAEPESEVLIRGPREGFTETLETNLSMIRRKIKSPNLTFINISIGKLTMTQVSVVFIKGLASPDLVEEVKQRLQRIKIDGILESGYLEEFIEDNPYSPFPQMHHTERPDRVAAGLLEGRVVIMSDGTPFALIVPAEITSFLTSPEDYYDRYYLGTLILWVRYIAFAVSLLLPSFYIAITTFHQEMIPARLLISIASYRQGLPFPTLLEALIMEFTFEVLREAGTRLPRAVGQAVSIVGALVIGQAAVQAGIVSPLMVITVAFTGIASFTTPSYNLGITIRMLRFPLMLLAGILGLFGVMFGIIIIHIHAAKIRSFGLPYLSSLSPLHWSDIKDVLVRGPWWTMDTRPFELGERNFRRQSPGLRPSPFQDNNTGGDS